MRVETSQALPSSKLAEWQKQIEPFAANILRKIPTDRPVDLVSEFAQPWCLAVAVVVIGADPADSERLRGLAKHVCASAAEPYDSDLKSKASEATAELEPSFQSGPATMRAPGFVALSQTLACLLANMWHVLLLHPGELARLRAEPELLPRATDELLRHSGLPRILFRIATADVELNGLRISQGDRVILELAAANRDPAQFTEPDRVDINRQAAGHFSLGAGLHSCVGAGLIRMLALHATRAFVERFAGAELIEPIEWEGGAGFRSPRALRVLLANRG